MTQETMCPKFKELMCDKLPGYLTLVNTVGRFQKLGWPEWKS